MHGVRPWVQTSVSAYKKINKMVCCYAEHPSPLSHPLTVSLSALAHSWEWALQHAKVKLSAAFGRCLSRPGSPGDNPPRSNWGSDPHTNPLPFHCPFVKPMISAGSWLRNWLYVSTLTVTFTHRKGLQSLQPPQHFSICHSWNGRSQHLTQRA